MEFLGPLALIGTTGALLVLPVVPAIHELWKRKDAVPLVTSRHDGKITNFADSFRSRLAPLHPQLERCRSTRELLRATLDGTQVLVVGREDFDFSAELIRGADLLMCSGPVFVPSDRMIGADIYTEDALELGAGSTLRAGLAFGDVVLGAQSTVLRWLHSNGTIYLGTGSTSYGRLSANKWVRLERGATFQRLHAPQILTLDPNSQEVNFDRDVGGSSDSGLDSVNLNAADSETSEDARSPCQRIRVRGDFVLPEGSTLHANVIVNGELRIARNVRFLGSAKSYRDTIVEDAASVRGSLISAGNIRVGSNCLIRGPVMAENDVIIGGGSHVGRLDALTTVAARHVMVAPGCCLHGSLWARVQGTVLA